MLLFSSSSECCLCPFSGNILNAYGISDLLCILTCRIMFITQISIRWPFLSPCILWFVSVINCIWLGNIIIVLNNLFTSITLWSWSRCMISLLTREVWYDKYYACLLLYLWPCVVSFVLFCHFDFPLFPLESWLLIVASKLDRVKWFWGIISSFHGYILSC